MKEEASEIEREQEEEKKQAAVDSCEECKTNPSKYKCPGCSIRTCSLTCVNSHKLRTSCTGKRPVTDFVSISQFDENQLLSDYHMLKDVKRVAESAQRKRIKLCGYYYNRLPIHLKGLQNAAAKRRTKLILLSHGMSKREKNKTYYNHRKKFISWTIELRFHTTDVSLFEHGVHENSTISSVIQKHLKPSPWNHPLKKFLDYGLESLTFCIRKYPKGAKSPLFQLDINKPICEQLAGAVILEYPIVYVFTPLHKHDYEVINIAVPKRVDFKEPPRQDSLSPKGVTFKVEEIEDETFSDPHSSEHLRPINGKTEAKKESNGSVRSPLVIKATKPDKSVSYGETSGTMVEDDDLCKFFTLDQLSDIPEFDFEPSSSLEINPDEDDFFGFNDAVSSGDVRVNLGGPTFKVDEELEEGEIA